MKYLSTFCLALLIVLGASCNSVSISEHPNAKAFIDQMVKQHGFERKVLLEIFSDVEIKDSIIKAMDRPAEAKPWYDYRKIFITDERIEGGVQFWQQNELTLSHLESRFGISPQIIVSVIGVETNYGGNTGSYRVIDALSTLAFDYPRRSKFFLGELEQFIILCREEQIDPHRPKGSYAGAMGLPQFMPSSFRHYAEDFDDDGRRDIWKNRDDVVASVANYFAKHGWKKGGLISLPVSIEGSQFERLLSKGLKLDSTIGEMEALGVKLPQEVSPAAKTKLLKLKSNTGSVYWAVFHNFYVITRYNHSMLYAMAVHQLSQEISSLRARTKTSNPQPRELES